MKGLKINHILVKFTNLINFGRKPAIEDELDRLALDEEIEGELQALKSPSIDKMEKRVEVLERSWKIQKVRK